MKRNKILSAILVILMLFSILTASTIFGSSDVVHPGDVNRDGDVCVKDIFDLQRYLAGDEGAITVPTTTTRPITEDDFELTISVEETTIQQGENFRVDVELKNNSGRDVVIYHSILFLPIIPDWDPFGGLTRPHPVVPPRFFATSSVVRNISIGGHETKEWWPHLGSSLEVGKHMLTVEAVFYLNRGQANVQEFVILSNTIELTVE